MVKRTNWMKRTKRAVWTLVVLSIGFCLCWSNLRPLTPEEENQARHREFRRNLHSREAVVALARARKLAPADPSEDQHFKKLPFWYWHLSTDGEVYVVQPSGHTTVKFYTFRGWGGGWCAYFYTADDTTRPDQWGYMEKLAPHWYWVTGD
jgi:hypothetical protein